MYLAGGERDEDYCPSKRVGRRSKRIKKRKLRHCTSDHTCAEIERQKVNSDPQEVDSEERLPNELLTEILRFLPVKCLLRFKCVSKSWCAVIEEHYFVMKHYNGGKRVQTYNKPGYFYSRENTFVPVCSILGLVLERCKSYLKFRIRNPETKQILDLPDLQNACLTMILLYLQNSKKYKLACFFAKTETGFGGCKVLTVDKVLKWRTLEIPSLRSMLLVRFIGTSRMIFALRPKDSEVACIDMESESISSINIPWLNDYFSNPDQILFFRWNNNLSISKLVNTNGGLKLRAWVLEDFKKQSWTEELIPLKFLEKFPDATERNIHFQSVDRDCLTIFVNVKIRVVYHIKSKTGSVDSAPPGQAYSVNYCPSLLRLDGMKQEGK